MKWSPEQIVGYCDKQGICMDLHATIYQYIREDRALESTLYTHLRHRLKHRKMPAAGNRVVIKAK
jgi:IS30 family transposase